jgi:hypothetical protein
MHTKDDSPDRAARAAEVARSGPRPTDPVGPGAVLQLQRSAGNAAVARALGEQRSPVLDVVGRGGGRPLDGGVRQQMEGAFGESFGDVRIHTGPEASRSAESVQARAYTVDNEIVFGDSAYTPGTDDGDRRLAHELTHVVQQRQGPVDGTPQEDGIAVSSPADRFERAARANADRVVSDIRSEHTAPPRRATVARRRSSQVSVQRESADLLETLAEPKIGKPQAKDVQIRLITALDDLFKRTSEFNLGGILINDLPESDSDLLKNATLVRLPSGLYDIDGEKKMVTSFKSVGEDRAAEVIGKGLGPLVVENTLKTMIDARQIEYLRKAKLPNAEWKILVEVHYISARPKDMSGFHKDTRNETLFVNLNYHVGERDVVGPEYVVNPEPPAEHEAKIAETLPPKFLADLKTTRGKLGAPTEIKAGIVGPYGYVAFVDEAIHHTTPHYGQRIVTGNELREFLQFSVFGNEQVAAQAYGKRTISGPDLKGFLKDKHRAEFDEIETAWAKFQASRWPTYIYPFSSYVDKTIVSATEIPKWQAWIETDRDPRPTYTRDVLKGKGMPEDMFERMLAYVGTAEGAQRPGGRAGGFEKVLVNSSAVPVDTKNRPRLKRRMSDASFKRPAQLPEDVTRRFLRTWVRAIPAAKAKQMQDLGAQKQD